MLAMGIISAVVGVAGAVQSAKAQKQAGAATEAGNEFNAQIAERDAAMLKQKADYEEGIHRDQARQLLARQRVLYAKSGVDISEGSPLLVMADSAAKAEKDALAVRWQGDIASTSKLNEANLFRFYGENAMQGANTQATSTLLQGIGNAGMAYGSAKYGSRSGYKGYTPSDTAAG